MKLNQIKMAAWLKRTLDLGWKEIFSIWLAFILGGFAQPWWLFVFVGAIFGVATARRKTRVVWGVAIMAGLAWIMMAAIEDIASGGRISLRLSGLFGIPMAHGVYLVLFAMALMLSLFATLFARLLTQAIYLGENP